MNQEKGRFVEPPFIISMNVFDQTIQLIFYGLMGLSLNSKSPLLDKFDLFYLDLLEFLI